MAAECKYAYLDEMSTEQLENLLRLDSNTDSVYSQELILHILEVIEKREKEHSTGRLSNERDAWEEFNKYYNVPDGSDCSLFPYPEEPTRKHNTGFANQQKLHNGRKCRKTRSYSWMRCGIAAILAVVLLSGCMIVVQAAGIDVFGAVARWTDETFHFVSSHEKGKPQNANDDFDPIQQAIYNSDIMWEAFPSNIPAGFSLSDLEFFSNSAENKVYCEYSGSNDQTFSIQVRHYTSQADLDIHTFEKDNGAAHSYTTNGKTFYIVSNNALVTATWSDGVSTIISIGGNISGEVLKQILDSIGGKSE